METIMSDKNPVVHIANIPLADIEAPEVESYDDLVRSFTKIGQRVSIIVTPNDAEGVAYKIINGKRRVATANALGWETIRAEVRYENSLDRALTTLASNLVQKRNAATEAEAVEVLLAEGKTETEIAEETGFGLRIIRELIELKTALHPTAFATLRKGGMTVATAKRLLRLPTEGQAALVKAATGEEGVAQVRGKDVEASLRHYKNDMLSQMPQVVVPTGGQYGMLAAQLEQVSLKFSGKQRKLLVDASAILRGSVNAKQAEAAG